MQEFKREDPELYALEQNKESGYNYQERRRDDWDETYALFRDKVVVNRLTQRQSVNLPMMKLACQTNLKDIDDMPIIYFENLDNDKQAEVFKNEYWKYTGEINNFEIQDIVDKKQEWLYGRSFDQWQIIDGKVKMTVQDPMDILVDRYCDPYDLHSSRFLIHNHIFVPLSTLENNKDYDQKKVRELKKWYATQAGLVKVASNEDMLNEKNKKMRDMGVADVDAPILGETIVELSLHFVKRQEGKEVEQIWMYVECDDQAILMKKRLEEVIGKTTDHYFRDHYPYVSWAGDVDKQDFWSDGKGDIVRTPNKVLNSWFSQLVENRTLRNFGMHYFDSTIEGFVPQTFTPIPWGWYGVPGKPQEVLQKIDIPDLSESLDEMQYVQEMVEKATGATPTQQGVQTERQVTLGEVQLALGQAQERSKSYSKFYTQAWKDRGTLFVKLIEAGADKLDAVTIYKKGKNTDNIFSREITPDDWASESGYRVRVWSQDDKNKANTDSLEKLNAAVMNIPGNAKLQEIYQRKLLEFSDLTPDEINSVMELEQQKREALTSNLGGIIPPGGQPGQPGMPQQPGQPVQPGQPPIVQQSQNARPTA